MKVKWAFIDLDGTLLNSKKKVPLNNLQVLKEFSSKKGNIVLTTGRWPISSLRINKEIEAFSNIKNKYLIAMNGSYIYDLQQEKIIYSKTINTDIFNQILEHIKKYKIAAWIYSKKGIEQKQIFSVKIPIKKIIQKFNSGKIVELKEDQIFNDEVYKFLFFSWHEKEMDKILNVLNKNFSNELSIVRINKKTIEVTANNTSKGQAIKFIQKIEKFKWEETVSLGDSQNDISMFKVCNYKISFNSKDRSLTSLSTMVYDNQKNFDTAFNDFIINYDSNNFKLNTTIYVDLLSWYKKFDYQEIYKYKNIHNYLIAQNKLIVKSILPNWLVSSMFETLLISKNTSFKNEYNSTFDIERINQIKDYINTNKTDLLILEYKDKTTTLICENTKQLKNYDLNLNIFNHIDSFENFKAEKQINKNLISVSLININKLNFKFFKIIRSQNFYHIYSNENNKENDITNITKEFNIKDSKTIDNLLNDMDKFIEQIYKNNKG